MANSQVFIVTLGNQILGVFQNKQDADQASRNNVGSRVVNQPVFSSFNTNNGSGVVESEFDADFDDELTDGEQSAVVGDEEVSDIDSADQEDIISSQADLCVVDVPLMIRLLEWAREEASGDEDLHSLVERIVSRGASDDVVLTMDDYEFIVGGGGADHDSADSFDTDDSTGNDEEHEYAGGDEFATGSDNETERSSALEQAVATIKELIASRRTGAHVTEGTRGATLSDYIEDLPKQGLAPSVKDIFANKKAAKGLDATRSGVVISDNGAAVVPDTLVAEE